MPRIKADGLQTSSISKRQYFGDRSRINASISASKEPTGIGRALLEVTGRAFNQGVEEFNASSAFEAQAALDDAQRQFNEQIQNDPDLRALSFEERINQQDIDTLLDLSKVNNPLLAKKTREQFFREAQGITQAHNRQYQHEQVIDGYRKALRQTALSLFDQSANTQDINQVMGNLKELAEGEGVSQAEFLDLVMETQSSDEFIKAKEDNKVLAQWALDNDMGSELYQQKARLLIDKIDQLNGVQRNLKINEYELAFNQKYGNPYDIPEAEFEEWARLGIEQDGLTPGLVDSWRDERLRRFGQKIEEQMSDAAYYQGLATAPDLGFSDKAIQSSYQKNYQALQEQFGDEIGTALHMAYVKKNGQPDKALNRHIQAGLNWFKQGSLNFTTTKGQSLEAESIPEHAQFLLTHVPTLVESGYVSTLPKEASDRIEAIYALSDGTAIDTATAATVVNLDEARYEESLSFYRTEQNLGTFRDELKSALQNMWVADEIPNVEPLLKDSVRLASILMGSGLVGTEQEARDKAIEFIQDKWVNVNGVPVRKTSSLDINNAQRSIDFVREQQRPIIAKAIDEAEDEVDTTEIGFMPIGKGQYMLSYKGLPLPYQGMTTISERDLFQPKGLVYEQAKHEQAEELAMQSERNNQDYIAKLEKRHRELEFHSPSYRALPNEQKPILQALKKAKRQQFILGAIHQDK